MMKKLLKSIDSFKNSVIGNNVIVNVIAFGVIVGALYGAVVLGLDAFTRHGSMVVVPDIKGMSIEEMESSLNEVGLNYRIYDSVFRPRAKPYSVDYQDPIAGVNVKKGRTIYLTVVSGVVPKVKFPNIFYMGGVVTINNDEKTEKIAMEILENSGFEIGEITYIEDISDKVKSASINGKIVRNQEEVPRGSVVDLVVGKPNGAGSIEVPDLIGSTFGEAKQFLSNLNLNIGSINYKGKIIDTLNAIITRQYPEAEGYQKLGSGETIDITIEN